MVSLPWMLALCLPWQGRTPQGPAPVRCWNRPWPYCPPPQLGAEHTTAAEQGSQQPPHRLNGHTVERGLIGLTWPGVAYSRMRVHVMKWPQFK